MHAFISAAVNVARLTIWLTPLVTVLMFAFQFWVFSVEFHVQQKITTNFNSWCSSEWHLSSCMSVLKKYYTKINKLHEINAGTFLSHSEMASITCLLHCLTLWRVWCRVNPLKQIALCIKSCKGDYRRQTVDALYRTSYSSNRLTKRPKGISQARPTNRPCDVTAHRVIRNLSFLILSVSVGFYLFSWWPKPWQNPRGPLQGWTRVIDVKV